MVAETCRIRFLIRCRRDRCVNEQKGANLNQNRPIITESGGRGAAAER